MTNPIEPLAMGQGAPARNPLHVAALDYMRRGWTIIPTHGKAAAVRWAEFQHRKPTEAEMRSWFSGKLQIDGIAVILGPASGGLICRDFDLLASYAAWADDHPDLARTFPTAETERGRHVYFRSDWTGFENLGDGELRGDVGHYCALPPSLHPFGVRYRWLVELPDDIPMIDPYKAGFLPLTETQRHTDTETQKTPSHKGAFELKKDEIEKAISETLPTTTGQRNSLVFEFARVLKGFPSLCDAPATSLREYVRTWHKRALPIIGTKPFDDTWADFCHAWPRVRFPKGQGPMDVIIKRAGAAPLPAVAERYDSPEMRHLVAICYQLQHAAGNAPFYLSCRKAGELVGLDHVTAAKRLGMLVTDGILQVVESGKPGKATRYRYVESKQ